MRPGSLPALVFVFALALSGVAASSPVAGGAPSADAGMDPGVDAALDSGADAALDAQTLPEPTNGSTPTQFAVEISADGDAHWRVATAFDLDGRNDTTAFQRLADRFEAGTDDTGYSVAPFRRAASAASEESGREMSIVRVTRSARVVNGTNGTGYLVLEFTWTSFSRVDGDRIVVDDAFETPSGTWLPRLGPDQRLLIRPPADYGILSAPKGPVNGTLRWTGPVEFDRDSLDVTYERGATPSIEEPPGEGLDPVTIVGLVALFGLLVVAAVWIRRSDRSVGDQDTSVGNGTVETRPDGDTIPTVAESDAAETVGGEAGPTDEEAEPSEEPADELLSDEERVERLLERNGGRMKQATIVDETGWSNAKVSQLLSAMEDDGRIEKLRIGRENLISFPGEMERDEE